MQIHKNWCQWEVQIFAVAILEMASLVVESLKDANRVVFFFYIQWSQKWHNEKWYILWVENKLIKKKKNPF